MDPEFNTVKTSPPSPPLPFFYLPEILKIITFPVTINLNYYFYTRNTIYTYMLLLSQKVIIYNYYYRKRSFHYCSKKS